MLKTWMAFKKRNRVTNNRVPKFYSDFEVYMEHGTHHTSMQSQLPFENLHLHSLPIMPRLVPWYRKKSVSSVHSRKITLHFSFIIKPTRCTNFINLLWHETPHVSDSPFAHHHEFIHCTLSNGIYHTGIVHTAFKQDQDVPSWSCSKAVYKPV